CPYVVREISAAPMMWEMLFANLEMLPGVLAVRRFGRAKFGLGAGLLFHAETFRKKVAWKELGARLADDNALGNFLGPVRVSATTLETFSSETNSREAFEHYLRWQKTIRWCRPDGFAGLLVILPAAGWLAGMLVWPATALGGLLTVLVFEGVWALWNLDALG